MSFSKRSAAIAWIFLWAVLVPSACEKEKMERIVLTVGETELLVEVARSEEEKARGLMFREDLGNLDGMLFLFQEDRRLSFWMKNTLLPLSIAYISSDGVIREIYPLEPGSLLPVESRRSLRYALEVPRGLFEEKDIVPGERIVFPEDFKP